MLGPGRKVALVVDNFARATPAYLILPRILSMVKEAGAESFLMVANGALWEMSHELLEKKLGKSILESGIKIIQNRARERQDYAYVGITSYGTPVWAHKAFLGADVRLGIGLTQLNLWGYGGGGKIFLPGVCSYETIEWNHRLSTARNSSVGVKRTENRIRDDIEEAARLAGLQMVLNVVLNPNAEILDIKAGSPTATHDSSVAFYDSVYAYKMPSEGPLDVAISGSFKWDQLFAHACWSIANLDLVTKPGATIIVASPAPKGLGHVTAMKKYMPPSKDGWQNIMRDLFYRTAEFWDGVIWFKIYEVMLSKKVIVVTEPGNLEAFKDLGMKAVTSMDSAVQMALDEHGENARVGVLPYGKWLIPTV